MRRPIHSDVSFPAEAVAVVSYGFFTNSESRRDFGVLNRLAAGDYSNPVLLLRGSVNEPEEFPHSDPNTLSVVRLKKPV